MDRTLPHPETSEIRLDQVLHALADPVRLQIVCDLAKASEEVACSSIELPVTKSTTTHHFRVLREAGVIRQHYKGTAKMSCLRGHDLDELFPGLLASVIEAARKNS
ncbi:ArsR/SmtB family transcription factor [Longispora albida]|uniref:ArsR/SmtB family transcription factor n=1 Tax=Longispora albida TaxID=203523 RepID=UPI001FE0D75B|nr:helix-turn-helix transcriptional regulator [Longispora albida]